MNTTLKNTAQKLYKTLINAVDGPDFNRSAHEQMIKAPLSIDQDSEFYDSDDEWATVKTTRRHKLDEPEEEFLVKEGPSLEGVVTRITEKALETAAKAAGFSKEYTLLAIKYLMMETAREVGWMANCGNTVEMLRNLKSRFPVLVDLERAYEEGALRGVGTRRQEQLLITDGRTYEPVEGVHHPRDVRVPSNLDNFAIWGDEDVRSDVAFRNGVALGRGRRGEREEVGLTIREESVETYTSEEIREAGFEEDVDGVECEELDDEFVDDADDEFV